MAPDKKPLTSSEKKIQAKRIILKIIEQMLEEDISKEWFLKNCSYLCQADYDDVIQERSIIKLCGYPLCSKPIKIVPKQQYHICKAANKIYDITERKNFCSNECYKASNFLKAQLHSLPLYMRKMGESSLILKTLSDSDNRGSAGEEILFHHTISKNEIEKTVAKSQVTTNLVNMLQEDIKDCTEHLANLEIKEKVYRDTYVFGTEDQEKPSDNIVNDSDDDEDISDRSDSEDKALFPDYDNNEIFSNKHMPVSSSTKKALLIDPVKPLQTRPSSQNFTKLSIDFICNVFQDWFTEDTMKYLLGEKQYYSIKADHLFKTMVCSEVDKSEKLSIVKDEYIKLCLKIDKLPEEEGELSDTPEINSDLGTKCEKAQNSLLKIAAETDTKSPLVKTNPKRRAKRKGKPKSKSVSFAPDIKDKCPIEPPSEDSESKYLPEPAFPLVDSISQNSLRKQVLTNKLKSVYFDLLAVIGLHYRNIKEEVKDIINTFSLTPNNIIFKPKQLKCIGIVLFRLLTKTTLKEFDEDAQFTKLCENSLAGLNISEHEINKLVYDLISPDQIMRLQNVV